MTITFSLLSSGSRANCTYVSDGVTSILIDCGLSAREAEKRLRENGIAPESISAIVVTHEHSDHISGIPIFSRKFGTKVMLNEETEQGWGVRLLTREYFTSGESFSIGAICVEPFQISHDARDPVALRFSTADASLAVVTDLGHVTTLVREKTKDVDALVLESNHDPILLRECRYPWPLKQRIASRTGHLSNETAAALIEELTAAPGFRIKHLIGAHVSENSNDPSIVHEVLSKALSRLSHSERPEVIVANAKHSTPLFTIGNANRAAHCAESEAPTVSDAFSG